MPSVHHGTKDLQIKIVYYGTAFGGKTTNLSWIHRHSVKERRGKLLTLESGAGRTLFFDLLPLDLGVYRGYRVRLHLCTVPGQSGCEETRRRVLRHADGIVFVVDSQPGRLEETQDSWTELRRNLVLEGVDIEHLPYVVQCNKRDIVSALPIDTIARHMAVEPSKLVSASASSGNGVLQTLREVSRQCLVAIDDPNKLAHGRSPSILPGVRVSSVPPENEESATAMSFPRPAKLPSDVKLK